jgi:hypothetical protein
MLLQGGYSSPHYPQFAMVDCGVKMQMYDGLFTLFQAIPYLVYLCCVLYPSVQHLVAVLCVRSVTMVVQSVAVFK